MRAMQAVHVQKGFEGAGNLVTSGCHISGSCLVGPFLAGLLASAASDWPLLQAN